MSKLSFMLDKEISNELVQKIDAFGEWVKDWNKFSLVANSTLNDLWGWHFYEAFSIIKILEENKNLKFYDFGAGGGVIGFPLVLYGFDICFVERSDNKLFFFQNVLKYQNVVKSVDDYSKSLVIVRGVDSVLSLLRKLKNVEKLVLFKSFSVKNEIAEALKFWNFKFDIFDRVGNAKGFILYIYDVFKK